MHKVIFLIIGAIFTLAFESLSAGEELALFAIHPNSQAFQFERSEDFDHTIKGYRRIKRPRGQDLFVSVEPHFRLSVVKRVNLAIVATGSKSIVVEFADDRADELRKLRLNRITDQFVLLNGRQEVIGIINTVSIGVDTRRFSVPVSDITEAEKLTKILQPFITKQQSKAE